MRKIKSCLTCAFLRDLCLPGSPVPSANEQLRSDLKNGRNIGPQRLQCYKEVWGPETMDDVPSQELQELLKKDRDGDCFFFPYHSGSNCVTAARLETREEKRRTDKAIKRAAWIGVGGTIAGAVLGGFIGGAATTLYNKLASPEPGAVVQSPDPAPNESTPLPAPEAQDGPPG
jgi:hypothetical protein